MQGMKFVWTYLAMVAVVMLLSGCATSGPVIEVVDTGCDWTAPILISKQDVLTDGTAEQILIHNETWKRICKPSQ